MKNLTSREMTCRDYEEQIANYENKIKKTKEAMEIAEATLKLAKITNALDEVVIDVFKKGKAQYIDRILELCHTGK